MEELTQEQKPSKLRSLFTKLKSFVIECRRIWQVTKKPSREEWITIVKVTGMGMLIIGFIGFLINVGWQMLLR